MSGAVFTNLATGIVTLSKVLRFPRRSLAQCASALALALNAIVTLPLVLGLAALSSTAAMAQDEFVGPFASWANAITQYGARGDGVTDDTAALQRALNDLGTSGHSSVLFLPAGTYRITATLLMTSQIGVGVLGADPDTVTILWNGPAGGKMLLANGVRYSRWGRITWDGNGTASTAIHHQWDGIVPGASTGNEHSDEVFKNVGVGLRAGNIATNLMDAEVMVVRCKFINCFQAGVSIESWNALNWFIWYSKFQNCNIGVTNQFGAGNFHVYYSNFSNSAVADVTIQSTMYFSLRGNTSVGSKKFYWSLGAGQNAAQVTLENNLVLDTQDTASLLIYDLGPFMALDNVVRSTVPGSPEQELGQHPGIANVSIGNTFTVPNPIVVVDPNANVLTLDNQTVATSQINATIPPLPPTPANLNRQVFEVAVGSPASIIQQLVNVAAGLTGQKPVVHFPAGAYAIGQSIIIPAQSDVQIVGDGQGTLLSWSGSGSGPIFHLLGPSYATFRELTIAGGGIANGIVIDNADQLGGRVYGQQLYISWSLQSNILADHLNSALLEFRGLLHDYAGVKSIDVIGGNQPTTGRVNVFGGSSGSNLATAVVYDVTNGGQLLVQDMWYEGSTPRLARLTDRGTFTLQGARIAPYSQSAVPVVEVNGFHGNVTLAGVLLNSTISVSNAQNDTNVLLMGLEGYQANYVTTDGSLNNFALLNSHLYDFNLGSYPIPNQGSTSPSFLRSMLSPTRTARPDALNPLPAGTTDVKLYRVAIQQSVVGLTVSSGSSQCAYSAGTFSASFPANGGSGTLNVTTGSGCPWTVASNADWLTLSTPPNGIGSGTVSYEVAPNPSAIRTGSLWVGSQSIAITQMGGSGGSGSPTPGAVTPGAGSGFNHSLTFAFSDPAGWQKLGVVNVLINNSLDGRAACYLAYSVQSNTLLLVNDAGNSGGPFAGSMVVNGSGSISNGQCIVAGAGSSAVGNGNTLTLMLNVSFSPTFSGNKVVYMAARDTGTGNSGWQALGTWEVPGPTPTGPAVSGMTPARSNFQTQTYAFTFTDDNGWQDIGVANILINNALDGRNACYLAFVPSGSSSGSVYLVNDAGNAGGPFGILALPGAGTVQNSQCTVTGSGSLVTGSVNTLTLTLTITFSPTFVGNRVFYLAARQGSLNSNWQAVGSVTVP